MKKSHLGIAYEISKRYLTNPMTGDRYFSGYEVQILPSDGSDPISIGIEKNRRQAIKKAKECIAKCGSEFNPSRVNPSEDKPSNQLEKSTSGGINLSVVRQYLRIPESSRWLKWDRVLNRPSKPEPQKSTDSSKYPI